MRCEQVVTVVNLVDVELAKLFHVLEHLVGQADTFARILQRLRMVLVLTQDGTELQLQLAFVVYSLVPHRNPLSLVEFRVADKSDALFKVEDALFEHTKSNRENSRNGVRGHRFFRGGALIGQLLTFRNTWTCCCR